LEVADMAAGEIDLRTARWTIPAARAKNSHSLTLPLGTLALAELRAVWPQHEPDPTHKLLGRGVGGFRGFSRLKARIDAATTQGNRVKVSRGDQACQEFIVPRGDLAPEAQ
jgi:hypothetical protein